MRRTVVAAFLLHLATLLGPCHADVSEDNDKREVSAGNVRFDEREPRTFGIFDSKRTNNGFPSYYNSGQFPPQQQSSSQRYGVWYPSSPVSAPSSPSFPSSSSSSSQYNPNRYDPNRQSFLGDGFQNSNNLLKALEQARCFKMLELISNAGLASKLAGDRRYTIFAPTDEALTEFVDKQPDEVKRTFMHNEAAVKAFLLNHMVPGAIMYTDLVDGMKINSVAGNPLDVIATGDGGVTVGGARLLAFEGRVDIPAENGYVHKIDKVIYPYKAANEDFLDNKTKFKRLLGIDENDLELTVTLDDGAIRGINLGDNHRAWLAIPFAKPPLGELRFNTPQRVDSWKSNGTKETRQQPHACLQNNDKILTSSDSSSEYSPVTDVSEDCLYLNVHAPRNLTKSMPVLVWIHGDGYTTGSASMDIYDPRQFVERGDVVFVAIQYRLGVFGFLNLGKNSGAPGNVMALEWIQNNIAKFRGNPNDVTLMGEGSGANSAALHMVSPRSCRLFQKAILQSAGLRSRWGFMSHDNATQRAQKFTLDVGCEFFSGFTQDTVRCLRGKSASALLSKQASVDGNSIDFFPFVVSLDDDFLPAHPGRLLKEKAFSGNKSVLIGSNANEGSLALMRFLPNLFPNRELSLSEMRLSRVEYNKSVESIFRFYPNSVQRLIAHDYGINPQESDSFFKALDQMVADSDYVCNAEEFAQALSDNGNNVYRYYYDHRSSSDSWPSWTGVKHGDELEMTFGHPLSDPKRYSSNEVRLARDIITYWTNFVTNGSPNPSPLLSTWPKYASPKWQYLNLTAEESLVYEEFFDEKCQLWNELIPDFLPNQDDNDRIEDRVDFSLCK